MAAACQVMRDLSADIARWIGSQPSVGEESMTDWLLWQLATRLPWVRYRKYNRIEEGRSTGADWDWYLVGPHVSLQLRVQAKKVIAGQDHYPDLARANRRGLQIEMLRASADRDNMLPFYVLYGSSPTPTALLCGGQHVTSTGDGAFLAAADRIYAEFFCLPRSPIQLDQLLALANPLHCILCCPVVARNGNVVDGVLDFVRQYYPQALEGRGRMDSPGIVRSLPAHVQSILDHPEGIPDWWEAEFSFATRDSKAILIWDLRNIRGA